MNRIACWALLAVAACGAELAAGEPVADEYRIKREADFAFAKQPAAERNGDNVAIAFETHGFCDVTVAVEDGDGRIVRHLASGVLGDNAPPPFQKKSKAQRIVWDGKDDAGHYIDDKDSHVVRVSLGLKPQLERSLFWHPFKQRGNDSPILCAAPEGVYLYQGEQLDHVLLFDHDGTYARTVYPFPSAMLGKVQGLRTHAFPQDGQTLPLKYGFHQATLLPGGANYGMNDHTGGVAATAMAVRGGTLVLAEAKTTWLGTDGSSGGRALLGQEAEITVKVCPEHRWIDGKVTPREAALSPDGQWLYLTGYGWSNFARPCEWHHVVMRMKSDGTSPMELFAGSMERRDSGEGPDKLNVPTSVACDRAGRVYVSDYMNHRIQVFATDKKLLKSIPTKYPAKVEVDPQSGEIFVFTWVLPSLHTKDDEKWKAELTQLGSFDDPKKIASYALPMGGQQVFDSDLRPPGRGYRVAVDFWAKPLTVWVVPGGGKGATPEQKTPVLLQVADGKLQAKRNPAKEALETVARLRAPAFARQRLHFNAANGKLYVAEGDAGTNKSVMQLVEIDPATGKTGLLELPFDAEDLCFGPDGTAYLRTDTMVVRYESKTWREVPYDYGEERKKLAFSFDGRGTPVIAGIPLPSRRPGCFHQGGMWANVKGNLVVACHNSAEKEGRNEGRNIHKDEGTVKYVPRLYPGRVRGSDIHVWDKYGKQVYEDAVPGVGGSHGIGIDNDDAIYILAAPARLIGGKRVFDARTCTLIKFRPNRAKLLSDTGRTPVPLEAGAEPKRPAEIANRQQGQVWAEGAEWFYGGLGFGGNNDSGAGGGCSCWNCRPTFDSFARSFAPETRHYSVAVLDTAGNLVLRIGRYGNIDDGQALIKEAGPANARSIGGDEVSLFHPAYLATQSDRRLFIADPGNARIASVKLGYETEAKVALKDVPDAAGK